MLNILVKQGATPFKLRLTFETRAGAAQVVTVAPSPQALIRLNQMLKGDKGDKGDTGESEFFDYDRLVAATIL